jgi:cytochrome c
MGQGRQANRRDAQYRDEEHKRQVMEQSMDESMDQCMDRFTDLCMALSVDLHQHIIYDVMHHLSMPLFLYKSILTIPLFVLMLIALFTMFEIYGRTEKRFDAGVLRLVHRINGFFFLALFLYLGFVCLQFVVDTRTDMTPRATFHAVFALAALALIMFKILVVHLYREFYAKLPVAGLLIALFTFVAIATSAGYYLSVTSFGKERRVADVIEKRSPAPAGKKDAPELPPKTDLESISAGKGLYQTKCAACHKADTTQTLVGPGLKNILKGKELPASKRPATPRVIVEQLRNPYLLMPSFSYLTEEETANLVAYLDTL